MPIRAQGHIGRVDANMTCIVLLYHDTLHPDLIGGDSHHPNTLLVLGDKKITPSCLFTVPTPGKSGRRRPSPTTGSTPPHPPRFMSLA
jgi:hypothetical protein